LGRPGGETVLLALNGRFSLGRMFQLRYWRRWRFR
jgi:hypothetical protein